MPWLNCSRSPISSSSTDGDGGMATPAPALLDWDVIELVIFDMDGTLYDQRRLRARMLVALLRDAIARRSLETLLTLRAFRRCRETLAESPADDFLTAQYAVPAARRGCAPKRFARWSPSGWSSGRCRCSPPAGARACWRSSRRSRAAESGSRSSRTIRRPRSSPRWTSPPTSLSPPPMPISVGPSPIRAGLHKLMRLARVAPHRAVLIGDRVDRDWAVAARANMRALILSRDAPGHVERFASYADARFQPLLRSIA